jgi:hypothetical protein
MAWTAFALALGLLGFGTSAAERSMNRAAAIAIADLLRASPQQVQAEARPDSFLGPLQGRMGTLRISASGFRLDSMPIAEEPKGRKPLRARLLRMDLKRFRLGALDLQGMTATVPDVRFEASLKPKPTVRFLGSGEGEGAVWTDADSVARYAERRFSNLRNVRVSFRGNLVVLEAEGDLLWSKADLWVAGRLRLVTPRRLGIEPTRVLVNGRRAEGQALAAWSALLSSLIDLDRDLGLRGSMDAREVALFADRIEVRGAVRIPKPNSGRNELGVSSNHAGRERSAVAVRRHGHRARIE